MGAVHLHRLLDDAEPVGDLLVQQTFDHAAQHLALAQRQAGHARR